VPWSRAPVSVILTAAHEESTIGRALEALLPQLSGGDELLVVCPDTATAAAVAAYTPAQANGQRDRQDAQAPAPRVLRDEGRGKPAALNLAMAAARHDLVVLTDGDVTVGPGALASLLAPFGDPRVGATTGHPLPTDSRASMLGYWAHLLTEAGAHARRLERDRAGGYLECSGYLYAVKRGLLDPLPEDALAEDGMISRMVWGRGALIRYASNAAVFVKYPSTYRDWLSQKVRSAGGYAQRYTAPPPARTRPARSAARGRSFWEEVRTGAARAWRYPRTARERWWTVLLFAARLHVWLLILWRVRIARLPHTTLWRRVETTK
jgi:cellulose synthase/poly-beta-1,6-N-acetylglucosamine synthase-like glycosyltransferase